MLLDRCQAFSPEYGDGLSTHLPMALQALHGLGAPPARLHALFDLIAPRLPLRPHSAGHRHDSPQGSPQDSPPGHALPALARPDDWPLLRGRIEAIETLRQALAHIAARDGLATTLSTALPLLMPGVAAVALHGLIRSAHGVAAGHADELISGLAYWAARHAPLVAPACALPIPSPAGPLRPLAAWLAGLQALPMPVGAASRLIAQRMQAHAGVAGFAAVAGSLALDAQTLDALASHAASLYAARGNFTVLHLVTGCQAMRVLMPWLADVPGALRHFSIAAAAALRASGLRQIDLASPTPNPTAAPLPWAETVRLAIASDDEHVIKLVQACRCHHAASGAAVFQAAASRAVQDSIDAP